MNYLATIMVGSHNVHYRTITPQCLLFTALSPGNRTFHVSSALRFQIPISHPTERPRKFRDQIRVAAPSDCKRMLIASRFGTTLKMCLFLYR